MGINLQIYCKYMSWRVMKAQGRKCLTFIHPKQPNQQPFACLTLASRTVSPPSSPQDASWSWRQRPLSLAGLWSRTGHGADDQHFGRTYCVLVVGEMLGGSTKRKPSKGMPAQSLDTLMFRFVWDVWCTFIPKDSQNGNDAFFPIDCGLPWLLALPYTAVNSGQHIFKPGLIFAENLISLNSQPLFKVHTP